MSDETKSIREQIILKVLAALETIDSIKTVMRKLPTVDELKRLATTQLPMVSVWGNLGQPEQIKTGRPISDSFAFRSTLPVTINCYAIGDDSDVSAYARELYEALNTDHSWGGLATSTEVIPDNHVESFDPYFILTFTCKISYRHDMSTL